MTTKDAPLKIWLHGSSGRMGREIQQAVEADQQHFRFVGGSSRTFEGEAFYQGRLVTPVLLGDRLIKDQPSVIIDFSTTQGNDVLRQAIREGNVRGAHILVGTTGLTAAAAQEWRSLVRDFDLALLMAPNTSIGILLTAQAALKAALPLSRLGFDIEVTETHHRMKKDAPSGTAKFLAQTLADEMSGLHLESHREGERKAGEIGLHSVRGGGVVGEHEIRIIGDFEEIKITHRAFSRGLFASGALILSRWIERQKPGFYGLLDVSLDDFLKLK
jgi:4-hydroxy-tetrahydrodipicolinate reductase